MCKQWVMWQSYLKEIGEVFCAEVDSIAIEHDILEVLVKVETTAHSNLSKCLGSWDLGTYTHPVCVREKVRGQAPQSHVKRPQKAPSCCDLLTFPSFALALSSSHPNTYNKREAGLVLLYFFLLHRQTDRQTDRQSERQTDRQTKTHRLVPMPSNSSFWWLADDQQLETIFSVVSV